MGIQAVRHCQSPTRSRYAMAQPTSLTERLIKNSAKVHKKSNALLLAKVATLFTDRQL